jgi:hypothetical protein
MKPEGGAAAATTDVVVTSEASANIAIASSLVAATAARHTKISHVAKPKIIILSNQIILNFIFKTINFFITKIFKIVALSHFLIFFLKLMNI